MMINLIDATLDQQDVFVSGTEGYHTYRIPSLIVSHAGVVLVFCEGRRDGRGDAGAIDTVLRRSLDGGRTWQSLQVVAAGDGHTLGNPCPVVDSSTGTIWLLLTRNLGHDTEKLILAGTSESRRTVWVTHSLDDGINWSEPVEITQQVMRHDWAWYATGPGIGIQLQSGRLLIPCDHKSVGSSQENSHVIWSDDHGKSWQIGGVIGPNANECQVAELPNGEIVLNMRNHRDGKQQKHRLVARSSDGGATWSDAVIDGTLIEPTCQASLLGCGAGLLFSNPASVNRENMTVRFSRDGGITWPLSRQLWAGPAAYSCLAILPDGAVGCLYERGDEHAYQTITLARLLAAA